MVQPDGDKLVAVIGFVRAVVVFRLVVRRVWIADALPGALFGSTILWIGGVQQVAVELILNTVAWWTIVWVLRRYGLLARVVMPSAGSAA